jgi:hypothetical protein
MIIFLAEASTPSLNISWLLHQLNIKDTLIFKISVAALLLSFFVFRVLLAPFMVWHLTVHKNEWAQYDNTLMYWGNWLIVFTFALLNYFWFYKLLSITFGGKKRKGKKSQADPKQT